MKTGSLEKLLLRPKSSPYRPTIWRTIGSYSIDPPERFCGAGISYRLRELHDPTSLQLTNIYAEIKNLGRLTMIEPIAPTSPYDQANWFVRINQEAWDEAMAMISIREATQE